ncbi:MAG: glycosyltransferase family 1 protein [Planctomycetota bacterium]|nr:MAG: glycosyltransferase family 1 protein [Planctomycetota bacterium]
MNVGVLLSEMTPETGGGYTFEREVFAALCRLGGDVRHTFHIISPHAIPLPPEARHLRLIEIPRQRRFVERLRNAARKTYRFLTKSGRRELRRAKKVGWRERFLLSCGMDMLWYPTPSVVTMEIPFITVVWDLQHRLQPYFPEVSLNAEWDLRERHYAQVLRRATYIVTGTEVGKREIERFYGVPGERMQILPHPTPEFAFEPPQGDDDAVLARYDIRRPYVFYPAQFWPHKNHIGLLEAVRLLESRHGLKVDVVLVGSDKGNRSFVEQATARLGITDRVRFPGFVSQHELVVFYRNALATTYVTYFGPENLPPLESFAAGCPVVASDVSGSEEQLGDAALRVDPRDHAAIADAIFRVHSDAALRTTLVDRGRARATRFRPDDFVREIVGMIDEFEPVRKCWHGGD